MYKTFEDYRTSSWKKNHYLNNKYSEVKKKGMSNSKVIYNIIKSVALVILTEIINLS